MSKSDVVRELSTDLGSRLAESAYKPPADGDSIYLNDYETSRNCQFQAFNERTLSENSDYVETSLKAARRVAIAALVDEGASAGSPQRSVGERVKAVLDEPQFLPDKLAEWIEQHGSAGKAMVHQAALGWARDTQALAAERGEPTWLSASFSHTDKSCGIKLVAKADAVRRVGPESFLYRTMNEPPHSPDRLARRIALVYGLAKGIVPGGIVFGYRKSLKKQQFKIGSSEIADATDDAVQELVFCQQPDLAPPTPGPSCDYCLFQDECEVGATYLKARRRQELFL